MYNIHWIETPIYRVNGKEEIRLCIRDRKYTNLHSAVNIGHHEKLKYLCECSDININAQDLAGWSPLHLAASKNVSKCVTILLDHKANINMRDNYGKTPLHIASQFGRYENVKILLKNDADIHAKTIDNRTALYAAVVRGKEKVCHLLLLHGADLNDEDNDATSLLKIAIDENHPEILDLLIEFGANVNVRIDNKSTLLMYAIEKGFQECTEVLIKHGANINRVSCQGKVALHQAILNGWQDTVKLLLEYGVNLEMKDKHGKTAMHKVVMNYSMKNTLLSLLHYGADVNAGSSIRMSPFENVIKSEKDGYEKYIEILLMFGARFDVNLNYSDKTAQIIRQYFIKRRIARLSLSRVGVKIANSDNLKTSDFEKCCVEELKEMKKVKLYDEVKLYDFLHGNTRSLVIFLSNPDVCETIDELLTSKRFPIYDNILDINFITGKLYMPVFGIANDYLTAACQFKLPECVINKVLNYLNLKDMYEFVKVMVATSVVSKINCNKKELIFQNICRVLKSSEYLNRFVESER